MRFPILFFVFFVASHLRAQDTIVSFSGHVLLFDFPKNYQLYERDRATDSARVHINGIVKAPATYDSIRLEITMADSSVAVTQQVLNYTSGEAPFDLYAPLPADLFNHEFSIFGVENGIKHLEYSVINVVAGDVLLINGQSNAQAYLSPMPEDVVSFTRGYHNGLWGTLDQAFPGRWGGHLAKLLQEKFQRPFAVFNFADGAQPIWYFQKNEQDSMLGNYGQMLRTFHETGIRKPVAAFWFHGEANGWDTDIETYYKAYDSLHTSWKQDLDIYASFLFQVRYRGCAHILPYVYEAQRQIAADRDDIEIMSTTNADHDSCHYGWEDGYKVLAARMADLVAPWLGAPPAAPEDYAPDIQHAVWQDSQNVVLLFTPGTIMSVIGDPSADFRIEESGALATSVSASGITLHLHFDQPVQIGQHLSYLSHPGNAPDWVVNPKGVGILEFYHIPIESPEATTLPDRKALSIAYDVQNPGQVVVSWGGGPAELSVLDIRGRCLRTIPSFRSGQVLDVGDLPAGLLLLRCRTKAKEYYGRVMHVE